MMSKRQKGTRIQELAQELDVFDKMLSSLVELLEDKGVLTQEEWEEKIKVKIEKTRKLINHRKIEFEE